jgi:hypothetical protein
MRENFTGVILKKVGGSDQPYVMEFKASGTDATGLYMSVEELRRLRTAIDNILGEVYIEVEVE